MTSDPFIAQLADLCRSDRTRAKWVVVPTHAVGRALGERLALEGTDWANLRFVTPFGLALDTAAPFLVDQGLDPLPEGLGPSLVMRLLMELPAGSPSYFRPLADQPQMGAALWATIRELRLAGVTAAVLPSSAFEDERKRGELQALLASYEGHLATHRQADAADVYRAAAAHADRSPIARTDVLVEAADLGALPLVRAFLDSLPGQRVPCAVPFVPGLDLPRRLRACPRTVQPAASRLAYVLDPSQAPLHTADQRLEMFHAAGREAEVEGVLRRILAMPSTVPLDHVEVVCASREHVDLFWEKAQRLELPVTIELGIPITATRPARALLGLCGWVDSNFVAGRLRRLFQAADIRIEFPDGAASGQAARLLMTSAATWGRETYDRSLTALAARYEKSATDDEELDEEERADRRAKSARAGYLREWIRTLLGLVPVPDEHGAVSLTDLVNGLSACLDDRVAVTSPLDASAATVMKQALADLLGLGDLRRPMRQAIAFVRNAVDGLVVGGSRARPGHLHVSPVASAGYAGRPFTFIVGLQEGGVFPSLLEDPVLLDAERHQISTALPTSHDRLEESVHAVLSRLAVLPTSSDPAEGGVCVSYSCRDLRDGRETFPSWLMLQALRLKDGNPDLTYDDLRQRLGTPETLVPAHADQALTDAGWWLATVKEAGEDGAGAVLDAFPSLAAGRKAEEARDSARFTEWDGFVRAARSLLDPRASGKPVSVTRIERLVACPFRYFVEHGLGVEVVADEDPDHDEWMDPMQKGAALHEVYATLGREARERGTRLQPRRDGFRARQVAEEKLEALRADCPPPSDVVFDRERTEFLRDVDLFFEFESNRADSEPVAFEVAFGHDPDGEEPLARAEPLEIPLGEGESFLLRGTIDRIDRLPDGSYEVIDYKTGRYDRDKWRGTFRGGAMLQHALYGVAAVALLRRLDPKPRVARGVYEFPSAKGGGERVEIPPPSRGALVRVLSDLFDVMAAGTFVSADDERECKYCDFSRACGMPTAQAMAKLANEKNARLDAYRRLRTHE